METTNLRFDWTIEEIERIYNLPLRELMYRVQSVHRVYHHSNEIQAANCSVSKPAAAQKTAAIARNRRITKPGSNAKGYSSVEKALEAARNAKRKRVIIETVFDQLKNISQIEHTRHRSLWNMLGSVGAGLVAYS